MFLEKDNRINWNCYSINVWIGTHYGYEFIIEKMMDFYTIRPSINGIRYNLLIFSTLDKCKDYCEELIQSEEKYVP